MDRPTWSPDPETLREMLSDMHAREAGSVLTQDEVAAVLWLMAVALDTLKCPVGDCENCNNYRLLFWDLSNGLPRNLRIRYQANVRAAGYNLPEAPWEEVEIK